MRSRLVCPYSELGRLREMHLGNEWSDASPKEEDMALENLLNVVRNYFRRGYWIRTYRGGRW